MFFVYKYLKMNTLYCFCFFWYNSWLMACKANTIMTILLFLILILLCWATYKSIDWFEKI